MTNKHNLNILWRSMMPNKNRQVYHIQLPVAVLQVELCDGVIGRSEWLSIPPGQVRVDYSLHACPIQLHSPDAEWRSEQKVNAPDFKRNKALLDQLSRMLQTPESYCELPLLMQGTAFRQRVWLEMSRIPLAETMSYKALAEGLLSSPRAVANACRDNPFPGIIPCHRVVSVNGIGGFMGQSEGSYVDLKRSLLQYEQRIQTHYQSPSR